MADRWVMVLAGCAVVGALRPTQGPLVLGLLAVTAALLLRRPTLLCLAMAVLVSTLAGRALSGLDGVVEAPVRAEVTLLTDPRPSFSGVRADARLGRRRVELRADGPSATDLGERLAGERVTIRGDVAAVSTDSPWLAARHIAARVRIYAVESWRPGDVATRTANAVRRTLERGAAPLDPTARSLYTGLVIGDDRAQPAALADDFRGSGLTHLLAVSGQNVAFALAIAAPVLRRMRIWPRLALTLAVIAMFGLITRFEPSVLRAACMAGLAATLVTIGGPVSRLRVLGLALTALLVVDPLLVRSVGFQLSAAATAAIVVLAPALAAALPGPVAVRDAMAVTIAAQLGVAPVLLAVFGPLPVTSFPANLCAVPVAGAVMVWGLTGGLLAGVLGGWWASVLHLPTSLLLGWVSEVAERSAALPLGELHASHLMVLGGGLALAAWARTSGRDISPRVGHLGMAFALAAVGVALVSAQAPPPLRAALATGVVRWHHGSTDIVVLGGAGGRSRLGAGMTLEVLRRAGVRGIDLLVVADASVTGPVVAAIEARHPAGAIFVAGGVDLVDARAPTVVAPRPTAVVQVGSLEVRLVATADRLVVDAVPRAPPAEGTVRAPR